MRTFRTFRLRDQTYDKEGNFEVDAANHSVSDHSSTHRARRIELCEHVENGAPFGVLLLLYTHIPS